MRFELWPSQRFGDDGFAASTDEASTANPVGLCALRIKQTACISNHHAHTAHRPEVDPAGQRIDGPCPCSGTAHRRPCPDPRGHRLWRTRRSPSSHSADIQACQELYAEWTAWQSVLATRLGCQTRRQSMGASCHVLGCKVDTSRSRSDNSADYMQGTRMNFRTKEDAIAFAEKQGILLQITGLIIGWEYYIQEPHNRQFKPKAYATNFNYCKSSSTGHANHYNSSLQTESHHHQIVVHIIEMPIAQCISNA